MVGVVRPSVRRRPVPPPPPRICWGFFFPSQFVTIKFRRDAAHLVLGCEQRHIKEGIPNISHECTLCKEGGKKLMAPRLKYVPSAL